MSTDNPGAQPPNPETQANREAVLSDLAKQIRGHVAKIQKALRASLQFARAAGQALQKAKEIVKDNGGAWLRWCKKNCNLSLRQVQKYMQIAEGFDELIKEGHDPEKLTINQALTLLAGLRDKKKQTADKDSAAPSTAAEKAPSPFQMSETDLRICEWEARRLVNEGRISCTDPPAGEFVQQKVKKLAEQIRKQAIKLVAAQDQNASVKPIHLAIALLERLSQELQARVLLETQNPKAETPVSTPEVNAATSVAPSLTQETSTPLTVQPPTPVAEPPAPALTEPIIPVESVPTNTGKQRKSNRHKRNGTPEPVA
jgi:hypothetical protein